MGFLSWSVLTILPAVLVAGAPTIPSTVVSNFPVRTHVSRSRVTPLYAHKKGSEATATNMHQLDVRASQDDVLLDKEDAEIEATLREERKVKSEKEKRQSKEKFHKDHNIDVEREINAKLREKNQDQRRKEKESFLEQADVGVTVDEEEYPVVASKYSDYIPKEGENPNAAPQNNLPWVALLLLSLTLFSGYYFKRRNGYQSLDSDSVISVTV